MAALQKTTKITLMLAAAFLTITTLQGCSTRSEEALEFAKAVFEKPQDVTLTQAQINAYPFAAQYAQLDGYSRNLFALQATQTVKNGEALTYVAPSGELFTALHGRIVHTSGLAGGIQHYQNLANDPLQCLQQYPSGQTESAKPCATNWETKLSVGGVLPHDLHQHAANSVFSNQGAQTLELPNGSTLKVWHWQETISAPSLQAEPIQNHYYIAEQPPVGIPPNAVVKSRQFVSSVYQYTTMEIVKPYGGGYVATDLTGPGPTTTQVVLQQAKQSEQLTSTVPQLTRVQQPIRNLLSQAKVQVTDIFWPSSRVVNSAKQQQLQQQRQQLLNEITNNQPLQQQLNEWPLLAGEPVSKLKLTTNPQVQPDTQTTTSALSFAFYQAETQPSFNGALTAEQYWVVVGTTTPNWLLIGNTGQLSPIQIAYAPNTSVQELLTKHLTENSQHSFSGTHVYVADAHGVVQQVPAQSFNETTYKLPVGAVIYVPVKDDQLHQQLLKLLPYVHAQGDTATQGGE